MNNNSHISGRVLVIHGPSLNLVGSREPTIYGNCTLDEINHSMLELARTLDLEVKIIQSNHEGGIIEALQAARDWADAIIINPAAYTHYSIAIRDAILAVGLPTIEVHISNIYQREEFRHRSVIAGVASGQISGFGALSYLLAIQAVKYLLEQRQQGNSSSQKCESDE